MPGGLRQRFDEAKRTGVKTDGMVRPASFGTASEARMTGSHQSATERTMDKVARVGIDLAKKVFHVTAVDAAGAVLERKRLRRAGLQSYLALLPPGCTVAMEACGGAHQLGATCGAPWPPRGSDEPAVRGPVREVEQERRQRRGRDRGGVRATGDAVRAGEGGGAGARPAAAPRAADGGAQPHGPGQPDPRLSAGVRHRVAARKGAMLRRLAEVLEDAENELPVEGRALLRELGTSSGAWTNGWRCSMQSSRAWRNGRRRAGG